MKKRSKLLVALCALFVMMFSMSMLTYATETSLQKPGKVAGLKQIDAGETSLRVQWKADAVADYYDIYVSETGKEDSFVKNNSYRVSDTEWYLSGLKAGKTYYVKVIAFTYEYPDSLYADSYSNTLAVVTTPGEVTGVKQTNATKNSVTLQWNKVNGATGYRIYNKIYNKNGSTMKLLVTTSKTKAMVKNLKSSQEYNLYVYAYRKAGSYVAEQEYTSTTGYISDYDLRIVPAKLSTTKIKVSDYFSSLKEVYVKWDELKFAEGYQIQVFSYNGKTSKYTTTSTYESVYLEKIDASRFYKIRIRGYVTINKTKKYGEWSSYKYVGQQVDVKSVVQTKTTKRQAKVTWGKMEGATNYTVYMSTKKDSGYKQVGSTSKTTLTISKFGNSNLQKNKDYYVYVVANRKIGKSVYKSGAAYCWKFKLSK